MKTKRIGNKLLLILVLLIFVFGVGFGDDCDNLENIMETKSQAYNDCYHNCTQNYNPCNEDCEIACNDMCVSQYAEFLNAQQEYDDCINNTISISGPIIVDNWLGFDSLSLSVSYSFNGNNIGNFSQSFACNGHFTVNGGTLTNVSTDNGNRKCTVNVGNITQNTVVLNISPGVATIGTHVSDGGTFSFSRTSGDCTNPPGGQYNDDCSIYGGNWSIDFNTNCCVEGSSCLVVPDLGGSCPDGYDIDENGCCIEAIRCDPPLALPNTLNGTQSCPLGYSLQNGCCACELFAGENGCGDGYSPNSAGCCRPASQMCEENEYMPSGSTGCTSCEEGTIPNESHTRCICDPNFKCCGVQLNNVVPFIGDCIEMNAESSRDNTTNVNSMTAFPILMQGLMKILMSVILIFSFLMIIVAGLLIVSGAFGGNGFTTGVKIIKNVIISLILLGSSGLILSLINPSFFGG